MQQRLLGTAGTAGRWQQHCLCSASAHTLTTRRACTLGLGWRVCWQAVHHSCPRSTCPFAYQIEGACVQQGLYERQELLVFGSNCADAQPVPPPLPTVVLVDLDLGRGFVGRTCAALAPRHPLFYAFQVAGACVQQRFLERQELVVFGSNCASAQPVTVSLPSVMFVDLVGSRGYVGRTCAALAPRPPGPFAFQL